MKITVRHFALFCVLGISGRADELSYQAEVQANIQQYVGGPASAPTYVEQGHFSAFSADWGLTHTTPYLPQSVSASPLAGSTQVLTDLPSNPVFNSFPGAFGGAGGTESTGLGQPWSYFWGYFGEDSYSQSDLAPFTVTMTGGNFDGATHVFNIDSAKLPAIPAFSTEVINALAGASASQSLTLDLDAFVVPDGAAGAYRQVWLRDLSLGVLLVNTQLDPSVNSLLLPAGTFLAGDQFGLSVYDNCWVGEIQYMAGTYLEFSPHSVPEAGAVGLYLFLGLVGLGYLQRRNKAATRR